MSSAIGVDVGGTKIAAGVVDSSGLILESLKVPTPAQDPDLIVQTIADLARQLGASDSVERVGVCVAGFVDRSRSGVLFSPNLSWRGVRLREQLQEALGGEVVIENDANAAAWGEFRFGGGKEADDLLAVTVGTGVGGGLVLAGELLRGGFGVAAEIGHLGLVPGGELCGCGNRGCLEAYGSGTALVRATRFAAHKDPVAAKRLIERASGDIAAIDGPMITEQAQLGDEFAKTQLAELGAWLGLGIANIAAVVDPSLVLIGGGVSQAGELLLQPIRDSYLKALSASRHRPILDVKVAELGNDAGLVGVADLARNSIGE
ncbi:MAG TPA: ROK family glucokinase [Marmoricola sp.]|nr:ROK family glucokinase [Nocardioidaceae bacterium]MCB8992861.1 ROK family glucokinase [Nocardioidaceae bacterium]MCO5324666.1 ROK family glucokinase [Nocardioidaceae bacterium]HRV69000.1 ROK family glucokinase [Marmoricola sp.]